MNITCLSVVISYSMVNKQKFVEECKSFIRFFRNLCIVSIIQTEWYCDLHHDNVWGA